MAGSHGKIAVSIFDLILPFQQLKEGPIILMALKIIWDIPAVSGVLREIRRMLEPFRSQIRDI